jgi:hypothetical protein
MKLRNLLNLALAISTLTGCSGSETVDGDSSAVHAAASVHAGTFRLTEETPSKAGPPSGVISTLEIESDGAYGVATVSTSCPLCVTTDNLDTSRVYRLFASRQECGQLVYNGMSVQGLRVTIVDYRSSICHEYPADVVVEETLEGHVYTRYGVEQILPSAK